MISKLIKARKLNCPKINTKLLGPKTQKEIFTGTKTITYTFDNGASIEFETDGTTKV